MRRPAVLGVRPAGLGRAWGCGLGRAWAGLGWAGWAGPAGLGWAGWAGLGIEAGAIFCLHFRVKIWGGSGVSCGKEQKKRIPDTAFTVPYF